MTVTAIVLLIINLNTASVQQLQSLPGIGPALARRIVDFREHNQLFDIAAVLGVSKDTNIAAADHRDTRMQRSLETRTLSIEVSGNGDGGRQCGTQRYIVLFHQPKDLGSAGVAVFDAFDSSQSGPPHPFRSRCMRRHWAAAALCGFDNKLEFVQ